MRSQWVGADTVRQEKKANTTTFFLHYIGTQRIPTSPHLTLPYSLTQPFSMEPKGTIAFTTIGRQFYGFDVFAVHISSNNHLHSSPTSDRRLTDGVSVNFNAQFTDEPNTVVFVSERTGSPNIYLSRSGNQKPGRHFRIPGSLFHDRPILKNGKLYFVSAHEPAARPFDSWSAVYSIDVGSDDDQTAATARRLTPNGVADFSPAVSRSGSLIAVASYGSRPWAGDFHELNTEIVVFPESDPSNRTTVCERGGWPTWSGDSTIYFHRVADDGWWSIFRVHRKDGGAWEPPSRVTPPGAHAFTPAAFQDCRTRIAVATRRRGTDFRHIEIFDLETQTFYPVTESINPKMHHYNPFVSPRSDQLGYHRFRGESAPGESIAPHVDPVASPIKDLRMLRVEMFPSYSPGRDLFAVNVDFVENVGVNIVKSDGSKRWNLVAPELSKTTFYNSWSPSEKNVIYTSIGQIFQSVGFTVQIARISFDLSMLTDDCDDVPAQVKILTRADSGNNAFPACSPDGKSIVFRSGRSGHKNLYLLDANNGEFDSVNGGGIKQLTAGPWIDTMPSWSPDGELIVFSSNRHCPDNPEVFGIYVVKKDGSGVRRIAVTGAEYASRERINHVCFSPDGEWLVFAANVSGVTAEPVGLPNQFQPYGDIHIARVDGSGLRRLTCNSYENGTPTWIAGDDEEVMVKRLSVAAAGGDKLRGQFKEPLWITCDF